MPAPVPNVPLPAPIDSCLSSLAASPPWQALVRCWSHANPTLPASSVYLHVLHSPLQDDLASRINPLLDSALVETTLHGHRYHSSQPPEASSDSIRRHNATVHDAIQSLLTALPPALRANVALRHLTLSLATAASAYQLRQVVWPTLAHTLLHSFPPNHHMHNSDLTDVPGMVAMDLHTWLRRTTGQFSQVFLALSQVYTGKLDSRWLTPCSRLYALILYISSSSSSSATEELSQGLWNNPWATGGPDFLLARLCTVIGAVMLPSLDENQSQEHDGDEESAVTNALEEMLPAAAVVMMMVKHLKCISSRTQRRHLLHVAVGSNGAVFTGPSLERMEQCLRIFFVGIVPWSTLILLVDCLLCCSSTPGEVIEEIVSTMAQVTNGNAAQLGSVPPSPLVQSLPSITALHPPAASSTTPTVPEWLKPALSTSSVNANERKVLEDLADGVAFTQRRARMLVQRWQRTARGIARWCLFLDALRERVRTAKHLRQTQPAAAVTSKQPTVARSTEPAPVIAAVVETKSDPTPGPLVNAPQPKASQASVVNQHVQVLQSTLPSADLIKSRPLVALVELVVGQTLGGPSESLVMELALEAARKRKQQSS